MGSKLLFLMLFGMTAASMYFLEIQTAESKWAGTAGPVYIELEGTDQQTFDFGAVENLEESSYRIFTKQSDEDIGTVECISFKMGSDDAWMPAHIAAWTSYDQEKAYVYSRYEQYSTDPNEGPDHVKLCKQGDTTYTVKVTTSTENEYADTDSIWASVEIEGSNGQTETGILDKAHEDDLEKGQNDKFVFPGMHDVGLIQCIIVTAREDDMWLFTEMTVQKLGSSEEPVTFHNSAGTKMSTDSNEGVSSLKLCI